MSDSQPPTAAAPEPVREESSTLRKAAPLLLGLSAVACTWLFVESASGSRSDDAGPFAGTETIWSPTVATVSGTAALCLVAWIVWRAARRRRGSLATSAGLVFLSVAVLGFFGRYQLSRHRVVAVLPSEREYAVIERTGFIGSSLSLQKAVGTSLFRTHHRSLAGEDVDAYGSVVRPAGSPPGIQVVSVGSTLLVLGNCWVLISHDPGRAGSEERGGGMDPGVLLDVDPFVLLSGSNELVGQDADVEDIARRAAELGTQPQANVYVQRGQARYSIPQRASGVPLEEFILNGLRSGNTWVRRAAERIGRAGGRRLYPRAVDLMESK